MALGTRDKTRRMVVSALMSAFGVALLYFGEIVDVLNASMAVLASLCCFFAVIEYGCAYPWLIYAVTGTISAVILPKKEAAMMYILFFGFYPIIKAKAENKGRLVRWIIKEGTFNLALALMLLLYKFVFTPDVSEPPLMYIATVVLAEIAFLLYDKALEKMALLYVRKIKPKFKIK